MHIASNAGNTTQNDSWTIPYKMTAAPPVMLAATHILSRTKGGLEEPPRAPGDPPTPILEKTLMYRNNF